VGLVGALPLYLVSTPCLAHLSGDPDFAGVYSTIQDLSLLRLLQLLEADSASTNTTYSVLNVLDGDSKARLRIVVLAILAVFAVTLPALYKILKEINNLVTFRRRWLEVRCEGKEMGWLSSRKASGFAGWGEKRIKDHFVKIGLSSSLGGSSRSNNRPLQHSRRTQSYYQNSQDSVFEVDVQSLFTVW
jgi:calcium permeable stress-gated cation channel